jgi:hypothetical protein
MDRTKIIRGKTAAGVALLMAAFTTNSFGTPFMDECTQGSGCLSIAGGGQASFNFTARWDADTETLDGDLSLTISSLGPGGLTLNSSALLDYRDASSNLRQFAFGLSGGVYSEARIYVTDNGETGDTAQIQLLDSSGIPVFDTLQLPLNSSCPGGITIGSCVVPSPCQLEVTATCSVQETTNPIPNDCEGKVVSMVMQYTGGDLTRMNHNQGLGRGIYSAIKGTLPNQVYIRATDSLSMSPQTKVFFQGNVQLGGNFTISSGAASATQLGNVTFIQIYDRAGGRLLQLVQIDTSCSKPLAAGNQFGASLVVSMTTTGGTTGSGGNGSDCAIVGDSGQVNFVYTIKNAGSTAVALSSLTATDAFGAIDLSGLGSGTIAPGSEVSVTVTETVTGPFPFVNTVTVNGGAGQCTDAATVTINQQNPPTQPPPTDCDDFVTGGGWIVGTPTGAKGNFGVHGGFRNGKFWGGLNYIDHASGMHVKSTDVTAYTEISENCRQINFKVTIDGVAGTAIVKVCDNGEPGRNDTFDIQLSNGYKASGDLAGQHPGGGNIQLHRKCKDPKGANK